MMTQAFKFKPVHGSTILNNMTTQKTAKHTPGPWKLYSKGITEKFRNTGEDFSIQYSDGQLASHVAEISFMGLCEEHGEVRANANLIASAPELLEQLQKQLAWLKHVKPQVQAPESVMLGFDQSIKYIEQALSKAEGHS